MTIQEAVKFVAKRFQYTPETKYILDYWYVMKDHNGVMRGDCDDFAMTCIWKRCGDSFWKFVWCVLIAHKYRIYFAKTNDGGRHAVGYADGLYFDNFTFKPLVKDKFLAQTGHKLYFPFPGPVAIFPMLLGLILRNFR